MIRNRKTNRFKQKEEPFKVNERITAPKVRLVQGNVPPAVYSLTEALRMARESGEDLVEISPNGDPPVCKIISYSKFKYENKKKLKEIESKVKKNLFKEIRFSPSIDSNDLKIKTERATKFLQKGAKVSLSVQYKGREMYTSLKQKGLDQLNEIAERLKNDGKIDNPIALRGRKATLTIAPHPQKK